MELNPNLDTKTIIEKGKHIYDIIQQWQKEDEGWKEIETSKDPEFVIFKYVQRFHSFILLIYPLQ